MTKAWIEIQNETNCKISGLDVATRRILSKKFSYDIPGARFTPAVRLGRWDGKASFFSTAGQTYINLLAEIIPILEAEKYQIEINDQRTYPLGSYSFSKIKEDSYAHICWPDGHDAAGTPIVLRDYQLTVIDDCLANPQSMHQVPTGAGKCLDFNTMINIELDENSEFGKFYINYVENTNNRDK